MAAHDVTGETFGGCIAVAPTDERVGSGVVWRFTCACGAEFKRGLAQAKASEDRGVRMFCNACLRANRSAVSTRTVKRRHLRSLWDAYGTLYESDGEDIPDTFATACPREDY